MEYLSPKEQVKWTMERRGSEKDTLERKRCMFNSLETVLKDPRVKSKKPKKKQSRSQYCLASGLQPVIIMEKPANLLPILQSSKKQPLARKERSQGYGGAARQSFDQIGGLPQTEDD